MLAQVIKPHFVTALALALVVTAPASATTITFGDTSGLVASVSEGEFEIAGAGGSGLFYILATGDCGPTCADNGTHYASTYTPAGTASAIAIQASDGSEFSFQGFSGAESPLNENDPSLWAAGIRVTVLTKDGLVGHEDFTLDQINDGTGGVADFESFISASTGLLFVQIIFEGLPGNGIDFGIDNIILNEPGTGAPVPEPATLLLFGSGLAIAGMRRRMKRG